MVEAIIEEFKESSYGSESGDDPYVLHELNFFLIGLDYSLSDTIEECFTKFALEAKKD